ncbi:hypothetical protein D1007_00136 [Hordeum vulgare]|nr:hypothetical protein D1007_00136 [Hordeum vulgare]
MSPMETSPFAGDDDVLVVPYGSSGGIHMEKQRRHPHGNSDSRHVPMATCPCAGDDDLHGSGGAVATSPSAVVDDMLSVSSGSSNNMHNDGFPTTTFATQDGNAGAVRKPPIGDVGKLMVIVTFRDVDIVTFRDVKIQRSSNKNIQSSMITSFMCCRV